MSGIIDWLLNRIPLVRRINGYKSYISLGLYALSLIAQLLSESEILFPKVEGASDALQGVIKQIADTLESIGVSGLVWGVSGKLAKEKTAKSIK